MAVFFNGRLIVTPTTASVVNDDAMRNQNLSVGNVVAYVGKSTGGKPSTALRFGNPQDAVRTLGSGELLDAVLAGFDPSSEVGGPFEVVAVRVNPATQAEVMLKDSDDANVIKLTSIGYGLRENQIRVRIEAGTTSGLRVTTQRGNDYFTQDDIARAAFSVEYEGAEATAEVEVTETAVILKAPSGTAVETIDLTEYETVQDVVDRINASAEFTASVQGRSGPTPALRGLDLVTDADIKGKSYTVRADLQAVIDWFNSHQEGFVTAERLVSAGKPPATTVSKFLSGGSDGVATNDHWADAFEVLQTIDVQWITPVSGDASIHAMADTHANYMSNVGAMERRVVCGMNPSSSIQQAKQAAYNLNSDRTSLMLQGHYDYDRNGKLVLMPPYISAARVAGGFAGVNPGTPLTNKNFKCRGLEFDLKNPTETDELIRAGVLCLENTSRGYKIVKSISTWLLNENYNRVEQSTGVALDFTMRNVREAVDVLRGQKGSPLVLQRAVSITQSVLRELARAEPQGPGVLAGNDESPAYRNIRASLEGDVLRIEFECSPVIPVNYVLVTVFAVPFSGVAIAA